MDDTKRERDTGRYAPTVERPCVCGHGLGMHTSERAKCSDGVIRQPCIVGDFGEAACACECFKRARKPKAAKIVTVVE